MAFPGIGRTLRGSSSSSRTETITPPLSLLDKIKGKKKAPLDKVLIEDVVDLEKDLDIFKDRQLELLKPENLYIPDRKIFKKVTGFHSNYKEVSLRIAEGDVHVEPILSKEATKKLLAKDYKYAHLGLIVIGIKLLVAKNQDNRLLLSIIDERYKGQIQKSVIAAMEVDCNPGIGLFYYSPNFMLKLSEFCKYIKIGIQSRGFGSFDGNNVLLCIGSYNKMTNNSSVNFKLDIKTITDRVQSSGIRFITLFRPQPELYNGLAWNINKFDIYGQTNIGQVPSQGNLYQDHLGNVSVRFNDYNPRRLHDIDSDNDTEQLETASDRTLVVVIGTHDRILYPASLELELSEQELSDLETMHKDNKDIDTSSTLYYDTDRNIRVTEPNIDTLEIELEDEEALITKMAVQVELEFARREREKTSMASAETISDTLSEISFSTYYDEPVATNPAVETGSSSVTGPDTRMEDTVVYTTGNIPRRTFSEYRDNMENKYRSKGPRGTLENRIKLQGDRSSGTVLNLAAQDIGEWAQVIEFWKGEVIKDYITKPAPSTTEEMYSMLENYLGMAARAGWEKFKETYPEAFTELLNLGPNPRNFLNKIGFLFTADDPGIGTIGVQVYAMRALEQLTIYKYKYIVPFCQDFFYYTCIAGCFYNEVIGKKLFLKLPGVLGVEIDKEWDKRITETDLRQKVAGTQWINIGTRVYFVISYLREKCTYIRSQKELKRDNSYCSGISVPQQYGYKEYREENRSGYRKPYKNKNRTRKTWYTRKSNARKPYLQKGRHVRKYDSKRSYNKPVSCFSCGQQGHFASKCPSRYTNAMSKANVVTSNCKQDFLSIDIDDDISDTETIYSIFSVIEADEIEDKQSSGLVEDFAYRQDTALGNTFINPEETDLIDDSYSDLQEPEGYRYPRRLNLGSINPQTAARPLSDFFTNSELIENYRKQLYYTYDPTLRKQLEKAIKQLDQEPFDRETLEILDKHAKPRLHYKPRRELKDFAILNIGSSSMNVSTDNPCNHLWQQGGLDVNPCFYCRYYPDKSIRLKCRKCFREVCKRHVEEKLVPGTIEAKVETEDESIYRSRLNRIEARMTMIELGVEKMKQQVNEAIGTIEQGKTYIDRLEKVERIVKNFLLEEIRAEVKLNEDRLAQLQAQDLTVEAQLTRNDKILLDLKDQASRLIETVDSVNTIVSAFN